MRFERLLIKTRTLAVMRPESVATNRREVTAIRSLRFEQPAQRIESDIEHFTIGSPMTAQDQCVREFGVIVGSDALEPPPVRRCICMIQSHEFPRK